MSNGSDDDDDANDATRSWLSRFESESVERTSHCKISLVKELSHSSRLS